MALLEVKDLSVAVDEKPILHGVNLSVGAGETHVLMGPNGAGKSTLGYTLMGNPRYQLKSGEMTFDGERLNGLSADKRAKAGIFLSFQNPIEVPGVSLSGFIRNALHEQTGQPVKLFSFQKKLNAAMELLSMDPAYADRDLNVGFSGGEKKKAEILQMLLLQPKLAILDETDSGLDVDAVRTVSQGVEAYQESKNGALLIITHSTRILEALHVDTVHIMVRGRIVETGGAELIEKINKEGFESYERG